MLDKWFFERLEFNLALLPKLYWRSCFTTSLALLGKSDQCCDFNYTIRNVMCCICVA